MQNNSELQNTISRIQEMEQYLDDVLDVMNTQPTSITEDAAIREKIDILTHYYENGQWLQDYDCDARGELPTDLKRGVLAQDTLYDLLGEISKIERERAHMELWDAYHADGTLAGFDLIRGEKIPENYYHMVCEAIIQHTDGEYLLMQRSFEKEIFPGKWEIGAGGSALKGEDKLQAVLREIREETGVEEGDLKELYHIVHEKHQSIYHGFLLVTSHDKSNITLQKGETIDYKWVSKEELLAFYEGPQCTPSSKERFYRFH